MVFSKYKYRNFHNENKNNHPIQPYSIEGWCKMVNEDSKYCKSESIFKWFELYFYILVKKIDVCELPSHHFYWKLKIKNNQRIKFIKHIIKKLK